MHSWVFTPDLLGPFIYGTIFRICVWCRRAVAQAIFFYTFIQSNDLILIGICRYLVFGRGLKVIACIPR